MSSFATLTGVSSIALPLDDFFPRLYNNNTLISRPASPQAALARITQATGSSKLGGHIKEPLNNMPWPAIATNDENSCKSIFRCKLSDVENDEICLKNQQGKLALVIQNSAEFYLTSAPCPPGVV
jgi:hypothetical protein